MTDEQVKKVKQGLECCTKDGSIEELCKGQCPYYEDCHTREGDAKRIYADALALINRLEEEKEQIRKETAKEMIEELEYYSSYENTDLKGSISCLKQYAHDKYGGEVEE